MKPENTADVVEKLEQRISELSLNLVGEKLRFAIAAEFSDFGIWEYNIAEKTQYQYKKLAGRYSEKTDPIPDFRNTVVGWGIIYADDLPVFNEFCDKMDRGEPKITCDFRSYDDDFNFIWLRYEGMTVYGDDGTPIKVIGRTLNVTKEHMSDNNESDIDEKDVVTNLYTRKKGQLLGAERCANMNGSDKAAIVIFDIDNFRYINDKWGRLYGDFVLESFANVLAGFIHGFDVAWRISGDEFAVLKFLENDETGADLYNAVSKKFMAFNFPKGTGFTVSGGAADCENGVEFDEIFRRADIALYNAKKSGRSKLFCYSSDMDSEELSGKTAIKDYSEEESLSVKTLTSSEKKIYNFAFDMFSKCSRPDEAIDYIFPELGKYYDIDNISIVEKNISGKIKVSHSWEKVPGKSSIDKMLEFYTSYWHIMETFFKSNPYYSISVLDPISEKNKTQMKNYNVSSAVKCPFFDGDDLAGIVTFEISDESRRWTEQEINAFCTFSKMLSVYIIKFRSNAKLENADFYTRVMLDNQQLISYAIDPDTFDVTYISPYAANRFPDIKMGEKCYKCIMGADSVCKKCPVLPMEDGRDRSETEVYNEKFDCWFRYIVTRITSPEQKENYLVCVNDISAFLERVSAKDSLTGLPTFDKFTSEAGKALYNGKKYSVAVISVSKFRAINEKYGLSVGNVVLTELAKKIKLSLSKTEYCCRWGGGKFIIMIENNVGSDGIVTRIGTMINAGCADIFSLTGKNVGFNAGIYNIHENDFNLIAAIDKANSARKSIVSEYTTENRTAVFDENMENTAAERKYLESIMQEALSNNEFHAFYQPKVRLSDGQIAGAEALVRWLRPNGDFISPGKFVPAFEENGFITEMDFAVYGQVFADLRRWIDKGYHVPVVSVNVSRRHFFGDDFPRKIEALREKYKVPHKYVELEITESMFSNNLDHVIKIVNILRDYGFSISVDDFGSGYSNLNLITKLPVDVLKVDGGFFINHQLSAKDRAVISTIISLAHSLNLYVVSEGIENKVQVDFLSKSGCDSVQGFFFYKPMTSENFENLIK